MGLFEIRTVVLVQVVAFGVINADPKEIIAKCRAGDGECLAAQINNIIKTYPKGNPEVGLIPLNAIPYEKDFYLKPRTSSVVDLVIRYMNQITYGFENVTITRVEGFNKNLFNSNFEIYGNVPRILCVGEYKLEGKLFFPISGGGSYKVEFLNCQYGVSLRVIPQYRGDKTFLKVYDVVPRLDMDRIIYDYENFYPDNSDLTYAINQILNENWREAFNEFEKPTLKIMAEEIKNILNGVFGVISLDEILEI